MINLPAELRWISKICPSARGPWAMGQVFTKPHHWGMRWASEKDALQPLGSQWGDYSAWAAWSKGKVRLPG